MSPAYCPNILNSVILALRYAPQSLRTAVAVSTSSTILYQRDGSTASSRSSFNLPIANTTAKSAAMISHFPVKRKVILRFRNMFGTAYLLHNIGSVLIVRIDQ